MKCFLLMITISILPSPCINTIWPLQLPMQGSNTGPLRERNAVGGRDVRDEKHNNPGILTLLETIW